MGLSLWKLYCYWIISFFLQKGISGASFELICLFQKSIFFSLCLCRHHSAFHYRGKPDIWDNSLCIATSSFKVFFYQKSIFLKFEELRSLCIWLNAYLLTVLSQNALNNFTLALDPIRSFSNMPLSFIWYVRNTMES